MTRNLALAALLLVSACEQHDHYAAPAANEEAGNQAAPQAANSVPLLDGQWRVVSIDGKPVSAGSAMVAEFVGGNAVMAAGCLRRAWTFTQKRNVVAFTTNPAGSANCGGRSPSAEQEGAYAALEQANIAIFGKDGATADLSGTGGNLALERR